MERTLHIMTITLSAILFGLWMALYSPTASADGFDLGVGAGIGICNAKVHDIYDFCDQGDVEKVFVRGRYVKGNHQGEIELYHFSHFESEDLHGYGEGHIRTRDMNGISLNYIYWFNL